MRMAATSAGLGDWAGLRWRSTISAGSPGARFSSAKLAAEIPRSSNGSVANLRTRYAPMLVNLYPLSHYLAYSLSPTR